MKVRWSDQAKEQLRQTSYYVRKKFGKTARDAFVSKIHQTNNQLSSNPYLGKTEPLLASLSKEYRSIVATSFNKLVYHIIDKHIEVAAFWDTRREPKSLIEDLEEQEEE